MNAHSNGGPTSTKRSHIALPLQKSRVLSVLIASATLLLAGCQTLSSWHPDEAVMDVPYENGRKAAAMGRTWSCVSCATGSTGERAFFANGRPMSAEAIGKEAFALARMSPDLAWTMVGKGFAGEDRWFAPVRIFVPSIQPLVVMSIPWTYKAAPSAYALGDEIRQFREFRSRDKGIGSRFVATSWISGIRNEVEIRGSLPREATVVVIMSKQSSMTVSMPTAPSQAKSVAFDGQQITFERSADGTVTVAFARK